ncbi:tetratricopeptide repeat protein [Leifsonia sp. NPDC077715]|uniref:tetratricopeptide repeat protein n=1 Tax=Leifsonia sp. NPDC077715 TaxID=3155539 RepID=UPI00342464DD
MSNVPPPPTNLRGAVDLSSLVNRPPAGAAGAAPGASGAAAGQATGDLTLPSLYFEGTDANFNDFIDLSMRVPIVVGLGTERSEQWQQFAPVLDRAVGSFRGRLVGVKIDVDANPQLTQAFQSQAVPTVAALVAGRPVQLFAGVVAEDQLRDVFEQLLQLAAQNGVTESVTVEGGPDGAESDGDAAAPETAPEPPLPPLHQEAYDAIDRGDYEGAIRAYRTAIAQDPRDTMAAAGLAQVSLLARLSGHSADELRTAAAESPRDADAQLGVADLDISGGHVEDAFDRLLTLFPSLDAAGKEQVRARILEYFEIVGVDDPRVGKARARLASLLY